MIAGNAAGLTAERAAEFAFLLGTPIIFAAGLLEVPKLFHAPGQLADAALGGVLTGIAAYLLRGARPAGLVRRLLCRGGTRLFRLVRDARTADLTAVRRRAGIRV